MSKAGKTDPEIIQEIKTRRTFYRLSAGDIIHLHESGVSTPVIDYMMETNREAIREEANSYYRNYYWQPYYNRWYYCPPNTVIIKQK